MTRKYVLKNPPSPEVRQARAVKASAARDSVDNVIRRLAEKAPTLTAEQAQKIRALLASVPEGADQG